MNRVPPQIPALFRSRFTVDREAPFRRYLNRLEVEIGREDYRHLKRVELLARDPGEAAFALMEELTARVLATSQNDWNRELLRRLGIRVYLDRERYEVYYRLPDRVLRFVPLWRQQVLRRLFGALPVADSGWRPAGPALPGFLARYRPDAAGGVLLLRADGPVAGRPLLTSTHGPYDPQTLEATFFLLRTGRGGAALVNLGFSGREPLADENLERLKAWGVPLNPSNIDVIFPYVDAAGHPYCYKLEERFAELVGELGVPAPELVVDLHGCVGTDPGDARLVVGLGGREPWPRLAELGRSEVCRESVRLVPGPALGRGLELLRALSSELCLQFCEAPGRCFHLLLVRGYLRGRCLDPRREVASLLAGEERSYLPAENQRWLPGAGGNALQRRAARELNPAALCLHVEMPVAVRRAVALRLRELELAASYDSSGL